MAITKEQMRAAAATMEERKEPEFVKFESGDIVEGVLVAVEPNVEIKEKGADGKETGRVSRGTRYTVEEEDGTMVCFLGTHQINQKLRPSDRGHYVSVRYEGEDRNVIRNGNAMRVFKILVSAQAVSGSSNLNITDDDIPF